MLLFDSFITSSLLLNSKNSKSMNRITTRSSFEKMLFQCEKKSNNFNMQTRLSSQKQKEKADLVFKYMKSLVPFQRKEGMDLESQQALKKFYESSNRSRKNTVMILSSKVVSVKLGDKSKKRVKFLDEMEIQDCNKAVQVNYRSQMEHYQNPEVIKNELMNLQRSIFSSFKIKNEADEPQNERSFFKGMQLAESLMLKQSSRLPSNREERLITKCIASNASNPPTRIIRSKSELPLTSLIRDRPKSNHDNQVNKLKINKRQKEINVNLVNRNVGGSLSSGNSASCSDLRPSQSKYQSSSTAPNRSARFWKQQNDLMVEIFKNKLQVRAR